MAPKTKKEKKGKSKKVEEVVVEETEYDTMDLEMLREVVPMLKQQLEKSMLDRNYVQLERDAIQQYFDITRREVRELELAVGAKDREMELLEDNHRVELRVYQQKVKHLEYEHKNNIKGIVQDGTSLLEEEQTVSVSRERDLLRLKEQLKFERMEMELVNASKVSEIRQQHEKQLVKLRQQFDDGLSELGSRCENRLRQLELDLELRRRVEVHEVEERKNQHINDLIKNHKKAFGQMKAYYNDITSGNLQLIRDLQKQVEELKARALNNKRMLLDYTQENQKLSEPLSKVSAEIADLQAQLKERTKDQMALRNANSRLAAVGKQGSEIKRKMQELEDEYARVEKERDELYNSFAESIQRVQQQSEFHNQSLESRLRFAESNAEKASAQVEEIVHAANLDPNEMARVMSSLNQMLAAKEDTLKDVRFLVVKLKKSFNDTLETFSAKLKELGIPESEISNLGFVAEQLPAGATTAPAGLVGYHSAYRDVIAETNSILLPPIRQPYKSQNHPKPHLNPCKTDPALKHSYVAQSTNPNASSTANPYPEAISSPKPAVKPLTPKLACPPNMSRPKTPRHPQQTPSTSDVWAYRVLQLQMSHASFSGFYNGNFETREQYEVQCQWDVMRINYSCI
eukprot:gene1513-2913_t